MPDGAPGAGERGEDWLDWLAAQARGMAHDFANPLAGLSLALEMLEQQAASPLQQKYAERCRSAVVRLLAEQQRWLAEAHTAAADAPAGWHELAALSACAWQEAVSCAPAGALTLHVEAGAERVWCQPAWLKAALVPLFDNGCRASGEAPMVLEAARQAGGTALRVRDAGAGIPAALGGHLFRRRSPGHGRSTGLGLLRTSAFVARIGGRVCACVGEGTGAVVQLWLPDPDIATAPHAGDRPLSATFSKKGARDRPNFNC